MTVFDPMEVAYVDDARGSHPHPGYDPEWSRIDQLRWRAGIIKARTGVVVKFNDNASASGPHYQLEYPHLIGVQVYGDDGSSLSLSQHDSRIETYLSGVEDGALAAKRGLL